MRKAILTLVLPALLVAPAGCGTPASVGDRVAGTTLTIYSSVPMHGASSVSGEAVVAGEQLALAQMHGRIGRYHVVLKALDDSTASRGAWDPGQTTANARLAIADPTTVGYLGEVNSGASAISIPILNRAVLPQISPSNTAIGLTTGGPGASPGEPQKYYPTGVRTYARVVPNDSVQADVQVRLQQRMGCRRTYVIDDGEVDGQDTALSFALAAQSAGLTVVGIQAFQPGATDYSPLARSVAQSGANCVLISAITEQGTALVTTQIGKALPLARIFGTAGVAESTFTEPAQGGIPHSLDPRVLITVAAADRTASSPAGRAFLAEYSRRLGPPQPYAIFGYEAMSLMLNAIARATDHGTRPVRRSKVVAAIFATRDRHSVLGTYSIDRDGDTSLRRYGVYRVLDGRLSFWKALAG